MSIYRSSVNHPVTTALVFIALMILGIFSLLKTSIAQYPDFEANVVMVMSSYPGANAQDVENNLTKVLENSLNGVENLKKMNSSSKENICILSLEFEYGVDVEECVNNVRDKLDMVSTTLPDGASKPSIFKFSADDMPIMFLSATADESLPGLDKILDDKVATVLARVKGVGTVSTIGAPTREIQVYCDPNTLQAYGLSVNTISSLIAAENRNTPSGSIDIGSDTYSLRVQQEFEDPAELLDIVVGTSNGKTVYLRDVARVVDGSEEREQESYTNDIRSARIAIQKQSGANTVNVVKSCKRELEKIKETLPPDVEIQIVNDGSREIINTINTLLETILITFLVVMLVVFLFLGNFTSTAIIIISIPIALLASLVYLFAVGETLNIISMSSLAIAIGMVVDDAIVVLENISSHLARGEKPKEAAVHATGEVGISVIASTLTMLCVFLPLTLLSGFAGIMFKQLGWIVSIIMIVSTTAALTLVPMLCSRWLKTGTTKSKVYRMFFEPFNRFINWISRGYAHVIRWSTHHRIAVIIAFVVMFVASVAFLGPKVKTEYFPHSDTDRISVNIELPMGTAQDVTREFNRQLTDEIRAAVPEVNILNSAFGQADSDNFFASMSNNGTHVIAMNMNIGTSSTRERSSAEIADIIRGIIASHPEVHRATVSEGGGGMGGAATVTLEIYGYSFEDTDALARVYQERMLDSPYFTQVTLSRDEYIPEYQMIFDRTKLALNGLNSSTAGAALSAAMSGSVASLYREEGEEYNIRVRYAPEFRTSVEDIENIIVVNAAGKPVRMKELGEVIETLVPPTIERKDRERLIKVNGIVANGAALSDAVATVNTIMHEVPTPSNLSTVISGDYEDQQEMFSDMGILMLLIIILVYMVMASQFESLLAPFVIMFSVPFAAIGVLFGLSVTGTPLGMMGMVGIIILLGIVVKNGIVLIDYTILLRERGMSVRDASVTAAKSRLRPILMTTLTTVLGMLPMALGTGEGAELWRSLGMVVCWGLTVSTLVTLVLIPTVYCALIMRREKRYKKKLAKQLQ